MMHRRRLRVVSWKRWRKHGRRRQWSLSPRRPVVSKPNSSIAERISPRACADTVSRCAHGKAKSKKSKHHRRADYPLGAPCPKKTGAAALRKWVRRSRPAIAMIPSLGPFVARLASTVTDDSFLENTEALNSLLTDGDHADGFVDDSLPSILRRCKRIERNGSAVSFLVMIHYLQLLCKCTT